MKTIIQATAENRVYLKYECGITGDIHEMNIYASVNGGYVKYGDDGKQLCDKLASTGNTLMWSGKKPLIDLIRREYYAMRRVERRELNR